jgi:UDPglucose 6-dehydrogenase
VHTNAYDAAKDTDAVVILTEWDEFVELDYEKIYSTMRKPAFLFDGRVILDAEKIKKIGFKLDTVGKYYLEN